MPSAIRVPLPPSVAVDPHFKIDIRDPTNGAIGLCVGEVVSVEAFQTMYGRGRGSQLALNSAQMWAGFLYAKLSSIPRNIEGLDMVRRDLTPSGDDPRFYSQALHAFIPSSPKYEALESSVTRQTAYDTLHSLLADVIACQVVWYFKLLHQRVGEFETRSTKPGIDGEIWRLWKAACPNMNHLDALHIVSIRRFQVSGRWVYFPEVEIRSSSNF